MQAHWAAPGSQMHSCSALQSQPIHAPMLKPATAMAVAGIIVAYKRAALIPYQMGLQEKGLQGKGLTENRAGARPR